MMDDKEYKQMIKQSFNAASVGYDNAAMRFFDKSAEYLTHFLSLKGNENVLDVSTGTGKSALSLARCLTEGHVTGIDLSEGMLKQAQNKAKENKLTNVSFQCMDVDALDFPSNHFDCVCCSFGIFFLPDMEKALEKIINALKPGGCIAITSFLDGSFRPLSDLCLDRFKKFGVKLPEHYTWGRLDHPDKHRDLFETGSLKNIKSQTKQMGYYLENKEQWWDLICYSGFRGFLNQIPEEDQPRYKEEHLAEIEAVSTKEGIWLNVEVIFTLGYKVKYE
ncbi:hypothetical protein MNBD_UNCLBAC01-645 [hydrothermal vent metagenome]|uniref:Methyltransferase domain-containing protein n=1 Tax=hydrothermal vent metagenome TaxID=652676 RepID=A0A3B1DUK8_9ZZZZ